MVKLRVGDSVGGIYKVCKNGIEKWELIESKINNVIETKRDGWKYYTKDRFRPLYAEDVDSNTRIMEDASSKGFIIVKEVFGLNEITRSFAERWIEWANENPDKAISIIDY